MLSGKIEQLNAPLSQPKYPMTKRKNKPLKQGCSSQCKTKTIKRIVKEWFDRKTDLLSHDSIILWTLEQHVVAHTSKVIKPEELEKVLPWVHMAITMPNGGCWVSIIR
jgi:hypothetical protein